MGDLPSDAPDPVRRIIHVDMDAFYASVEQRDDPSLRGRPVVVGGTPEGRGVVAASSYEARAHGVRSAMSAAKAVRLCPDAVFVRPDFAKYTAVSRQLHAILHDYTDRIEPLSLDEAYLDVTESLRGLPTATAIAKEIRARVREELRLTVSAGVAPVKFVAKIASDHRKPDGLTVVPPGRVLAFIRPLPVEKLWGVGPATARRLHALGARRIGDVEAMDQARLVEALGRTGTFLWHLARGEDPREVHADRERKSYGAEQTFATDRLGHEQLLPTLEEQADHLCESLARGRRQARTVTLKLRYADFATITRAETLSAPTDDPATVLRAAVALLERTEAAARPVRLIGLSLGNLVDLDAPGPAQLPLPFDSTT